MAVKPEPVEHSISPQPSEPPVPIKADPKTRADALKKISDHRKAIAWPVFRWPLDRWIVQERTKVHLPRSYLARAGEDVKTVWPGQDLNQVVHAHYFQKMTQEEAEEIMLQKDCANYVAPDGIALQR